MYILSKFKQKGVYSTLYNYITEMVEVRNDYVGIRLYVDKTNTIAQNVYSKLRMQGEHYQLFEKMLR